METLVWDRKRGRMSTFDPKQRKDEEKAAQEDRIQYVDELASVEDYPDGDAWISLTDAARVTRTSEAMARRWVTSGRLKVKKEAVGIPPRTRLVRLSDIAAIRPIVDPTAAITGEVRKLDLPSIPRQQLQIMEDHQKLLARVAGVQETVQQTMNGLRFDLLSEMKRLEIRIESKYDKIVGELTRGFMESRAHLLMQVQALQTLIQKEQIARVQGLDALGKQLTQTRKELAGRVDAHDQRFDALTTQVEDEQQAQQQHVKAVDTALERIQDDVQRQGRELVAQLETLERDQARDVAALTTRLDALDPRLEQITTDARSAVHSVRLRGDAQEQEIGALKEDLQREREAREALSTALDTQREQMDALRGMVETLTKRKKA